MANKDFQTQLKAALQLDLPYPERMPLVQGIPAAVLALFGSKNGEEPELLMTQRTETVEKHKGQMAFPGGMAEPGEDHVQTALRETEEELGHPSLSSFCFWSPSGDLDANGFYGYADCRFFKIGYSGDASSEKRS